MTRPQNSVKLETLATILPTGYYVDTWSPGDGMTRYRFFQAPKSDPEDRSESYFLGPGIGTEYGYGAAVVFAKKLAISERLKHSGRGYRVFTLAY